MCISFIYVVTSAFFVWPLPYSAYGHHLVPSFELPHSHSLLAHLAYTAFPTPLAYITIYCMDIFPPRMLHLSIFHVLRGNNMCASAFLFVYVCCHQCRGCCCFSSYLCFSERAAFMVSDATLVWNALCRESSLCCLAGLRLFHHISISVKRIICVFRRPV